MMYKRIFTIITINVYWMCNGMELQYPRTDKLLIACAKASQLAYSQLPEATSENFENMSLFDGYRCIYSKSIPDSAFHGVTFYNPDSETIITAFRGTDPSLTKNIQEDVGIIHTVANKEEKTVSSIIRKQFKQVLPYYYEKYPVLQRIQSTTFSLISPLLLPAVLYEEQSGQPAMTKDQLENLITSALQYCRNAHRAYSQLSNNNFSDESHNLVTGHSLGGFLAQLVCAKQAHITGYTFNAPGADDFLQQTGIAPHLFDPDQTHNYVRQHDVVGTLGTHLGKVSYLKDLSTKGYGSYYNPFEGLLTFCKANHSINYLAEDLEKDSLQELILQ